MLRQPIRSANGTYWRF